MVKPEWGTKRTCPKCSTRFYDLGNEEPVHCIECGTDFVPEPVLKSKQPLTFEAAPVAANLRASPYELSALGYQAIPIETREGKAEYVEAQRAFSARSQDLRRRLLDATAAALAASAA